MIECPGCGREFAEPVLRSLDESINETYDELLRVRHELKEAKETIKSHAELNSRLAVIVIRMYHDMKDTARMLNLPYSLFDSDK